eukprot:3667848-Amphidinium_carterae.2
MERNWQAWYSSIATGHVHPTEDPTQGLSLDKLKTPGAKGRSPLQADDHLNPAQESTEVSYRLATFSRALGRLLLT